MMNARAKNPAGHSLPARPAKIWLRALEMTAPIAAHPTRTLPAMLDELAAAHGDAPALISEHETLSYRALAARANRYARWALAQGVAKGDTVGLLMPSRPEYLAAWLGITRVGGVVALLNTKLVGRSLAHCVNIVAPRHVIVAGDLIETWSSAQPFMAARPAPWVHGADREGAARIDRDLTRYGDGPLDAGEKRIVTLDDLALRIYTSGTTGLPKAANVSHARVMLWSHWFAGLMDTRPDDRMYDCLPLYHSVGGVVATGALLVNGGSVVIADQFSARRFWDDIARWDCTLVQYIGELCRYLTKAAPHPHETRHRIRLACGNGLRAEVWEDFQRRFEIPHILEFYAATEGNVSLYNVEGRPGAIGRVPAFLTHRFGIELVRFDAARGEPLRDPEGRCMRCAPDEVGEAIGRIERSSAGSRFEGYADARESEKKILRDVFAPGDAWFHTGDLMRRDGQGYFYFIDRVGDTFRWKGENVATSEVADAIMNCPGVREAVVYGVTIPGAEGRAGMAAVVVDDDFEIGALRRCLARDLPAYARPVFLRVCDALAKTATFRPRKDELARAGYDPGATCDAIYMDDTQRQSYVPIDRALFARIEAGAVRL